MRRLRPLLALVLLGALTTGCGGAPTDAADADFCAAEAEFEQTGSTEALAATGTPADIPTQARQGFELQLDLTGEDVADLTDAQLDLLAQFGDYTAQTCG